MKIGFIGVGNIGSMFATGFAPDTKIDTIVLYDCDESKFDSFYDNKKYSVVQSAQDVVDHVDLVFVCVPPQQIPTLFKSLNPQNKIFITVVAALYASTYYQLLGDELKLIRIMPSMLNKYGGPILYAAGVNVNQATSDIVKLLLSSFGNVHEIPESSFDAGTQLGCCSPAFVAEWVRLYIDAVAVQEGLDSKRALALSIDALEVFIKQLKKEGFGLIDQFCTPGGITRKGVDLIQSQKSFFEDLNHLLMQRMQSVRDDYGAR